MPNSSPVSETCDEHKVWVVEDDGSQKVKRRQRAQWLRAAILGANDGLLSTTSLMLGVGAAKEERHDMILSGFAGAIAGACSMAVGEFVSVATQRDIERATLRQSSLKGDDGQDAPEKWLDNATATPTSIKQEANMCATPSQNLHTKLPSPSGSPPMIKVISGSDVMMTMARTLHHDDPVLANPYKAAVASGLAFLCGSFVPLASAVVFAHNIIRIHVMMVVVTTIASALFGGLGAYLGGSPIRISATRVLLGGWIAMAITYGLLEPFDRSGVKDKD
ncbi:hypothetical protein Tsubulata_008384 [Turnera subulata]|uniref:Vacuolar iron transporter n=1 Tax=Turnera subulata TaxID=218843 RepID=A0A9Q0J539_9ROSI|nr:hypothetical protein Tsubulata_008384 [Turnera subulata]